MKTDLQTIIRVLSVLVAVALAAAFGWRAATWGWRLMSPASQQVVPGLRTEANAAGVAARPWFAPVVLSAPTEAVRAATGLRLVGIIAGGKRPAAIVGAGGTAPQAFIQGETITDGLLLKTVATDHVIVLRNGIAERLDLPATPVIDLQIYRKESGK